MPRPRVPAAGVLPACAAGLLQKQPATPERLSVHLFGSVHEAELVSAGATAHGTLTV